MLRKKALMAILAAGLVATSVLVMPFSLQAAETSETTAVPTIDAWNL